MVGHCYEKGSLSLPYLAFMEALRSYVLTRPPDDLRKEMGTGAADVARIISEVRERLNVELRPSVDPEEERYRLMQAVTDFLVNASAAQPLLIVLEDLHDADKGTLEMLTQLSRNLAKARLLIIGTYRDIEVDRTHPLSGFLAELRRISSFTRVALRGLTADEVHRMLQNVMEQEIPWGLAEAVHKQTEGNPLFVQEVLRYLVEEGLVGREAGRMQATGRAPIAMAIPEGLRDVIGKRLSRLSVECNRILALAAVVGRDFSITVLQKVAGVTEEELYAALEEATSAAVLEERSAVGKGSTFRFAHAFFRQTLYEELFAPRRIRIHQQVGRALEEVYAQRLEEHADELAEHFSQSTETGDLAKAVQYGEMAAKRSISVYAYGEAVRLYEQCLRAQEVLNPDDKARRSDLLLALGEALIQAGEPRRSFDEVAPAAFDLAEAIGNKKIGSAASVLACQALVAYGQGVALTTPDGRLWVERLDRYAEQGSPDRVSAYYFVGGLRQIDGQFVEARRLYMLGMDLARRLGDNKTFLRLAENLLIYVHPRGDTSGRLKLAEEMMRLPHNEISVMQLADLLHHLFSFFLELGQRKQLDEILGELQELVESSRQVNVRLAYMGQQVVMAVINGRLEEGAEIVHRIETLGNEAGLEAAAKLVIMDGPEVVLLGLGKAEEAVQIAQSVLEPEANINKMRFALCLAHLGRNAEAAEILGQLMSIDEISEDWGIVFLYVAILIGHREAIVSLLQRFEKGEILPFERHANVCSFRILGAAKAFMGKPEEAKVDYQEAIKVCMEMRFRPELALTRLQLAELLLEHYPNEKKEAMEHLDFAIKEFQEMKMQPSLERALRRKEILRA